MDIADVNKKIQISILKKKKEYIGFENERA